MKNLEITYRHRTTQNRTDVDNIKNEYMVSLAAYMEVLKNGLYKNKKSK